MKNNSFAFSPGQLNKLLNPKSLPAFAALGGLSGIARGIRTDVTSGLSIDENNLEGSISFFEATRSEYTKEPSPSNAVEFIGQESVVQRGSFTDRIRVFNQNVIPGKKATPLWKLMWIAYKDKVLLLLTAAAMISLALGVRSRVIHLLI